MNTKARVSRHDPGDGERGLEEDAREEGVDTGSFVGVSVSGTPPPKRACFPSWFPCNTKITPQPKCTCNQIFWCFPGQLGGFQRAALNLVLTPKCVPSKKDTLLFCSFWCKHHNSGLMVFIGNTESSGIQPAPVVRPGINNGFASTFRTGAK